MLQRVIFLDIDGVLNRNLPPEDFGDPASTGTEVPSVELVPECIQQLNRIISATSAMVILTSDWRRWAKLPDLQRQFETSGFIGRILDGTPVIDGVERGYEVMAWLHRHGDGVASFVILDDRSDMGPYAENLVRTEFDVGLTAQLARDAICILLADDKNDSSRVE